MTTPPASAIEARTARPFLRGRIVQKSVWSIAVWTLFALFILGPLATVIAFSFTPSVFEGVGGFTGAWYAQLFSKPEYYGPLLRSFEIAAIVVLVQLVLGTVIAYSSIRGKIFGAKTLDAMSNITIALPSVVVGL